MIVKNNMGVDWDLFINFIGVLSIKQGQSFEFLSIARNSFYKLASETRWTKSIGFLSYLSLESLLAPLINKDLTGRVLLNVSTLFTAKCNGVYPSIS